MSKISDYHLITDNQNIYNDFLSNGFDNLKTELVVYKILDSTYWSNPTYNDWLLFVNISKSGLKQMAKYIHTFSKIIYVGCCFMSKI
jgi:hypothetical protein